MLKLEKIISPSSQLMRHLKASNLSLLKSIMSTQLRGLRGFPLGGSYFGAISPVAGEKKHSEKG